MLDFVGKPYVSREGAIALAEMRVDDAPAECGSAPIQMLARVPSSECGCPEELWRLDGIDLMFHFEADGASEAFIFAGDFEMETTLTAMSLDDLRAKAFQWFADVMATDDDRP